VLHKPQGLALQEQGGGQSTAEKAGFSQQFQGSLGELVAARRRQSILLAACHDQFEIALDFPQDLLPANAIMIGHTRTL
jgi:hypothetical protein